MSATDVTKFLRKDTHSVLGDVDLDVVETTGARLANAGGVAGGRCDDFVRVGVDLEDGIESLRWWCSGR